MKKMVTVLTVLTIFALVKPSCAASQEPIYKTILNNGLTFIYKQDKTSQMVVADMFIKGGTFCEDEDKAGITNLVQKLLLKGTINLNAEEIAREMEFLGGIINTEVVSDFAEVWFIIPRKSFTRGFKIFADLLKNPIFLQEEIDKEKKNALALLKSEKDNIFTYTYNIFVDTLYNTFPYHRPLFGYERTVESITREDVINYHKDFYSPNNMILVIIGNLPFKEILKIVNDEFGGILPSPKASMKRSNEVIERNEVPQTLTKESSFKQAYLMLGYLAPEVNSPDYPSMKLINILLGGGGSSKIYVRLREKMGLAYELGSFYPSRKYKSHFVIYAGLNSNNIAKAKESIIDEALKLPQYISDEEFQDAKSSLIGNFILDHQTLRKQAWYLGWFEVLGKGWQYDRDYPGEIASLKLDDLMEVSSKYLKENNWLCVEIIPEKK